VFSSTTAKLERREFESRCVETKIQQMALRIDVSLKNVICNQKLLTFMKFHLLNCQMSQLNRICFREVKDFVNDIALMIATQIGHLTYRSNDQRCYHNPFVNKFLNHQQIFRTI
jgi:hypothetical protein